MFDCKMLVVSMDNIGNIEKQSPQLLLEGENGARWRQISRPTINHPQQENDTESTVAIIPHHHTV